MRRLTSLFRPSRSFRPQGRAGGAMSGMRITLQRLGTPPEGTGAEGAAATGELVAWRDGDPAPDEPAVGTSDDSAAPPPTARLALAPEHPRVSARGETPETVRVVVIVPFREDGSGRESQLSALLARLRSMFLPGECLVVVAEQADDGRKFNRGQLLNAAFKHLRETHASSLDVRETLYCFHDCDMLPDASLAAHYLRGPPVPARSGEENDASSSSSSVRGFVRVLCADGGRYDADACFGGVTIYDQQGFEATNGYPNGFWGWGGEDNAQFLRCARAGLALERVRGCPFDDLEGLATVAEKLARLDAAGARCGAKEKKQLLRENARSWRMDGLTDVTFESSVPARTAVPTATRIEENAEKTKNERRQTPVRRFAFRLRAAIADEVECAECGERKGPSGFASHQHKRAMFYAARARKTGSVDRVSGRSDDKTPRETARESFWRERNRVARLCHWDERGGNPGVMRDPSHPSDPSSVRDALQTPTSTAFHETRFPIMDPPFTETSKPSSKPSSAKRSARCLACVAKDPRTSAFRKQAERNDADATRTTCARCGARFEKRNRLFEHLKASPCGVRDGEVIEGHVSSRRF